MGFYLKKILSFCLDPFGASLMLMLAGLWLLVRDNRKKAILCAGSAIFILTFFSLPPVADMLVYPLEQGSRKGNDIPKDIKWIHVLGSGNNSDRSQPLSSRIGGNGLKRVVEGIVQYRLHPGSKLIFTGYAGFSKDSIAQVASSLAEELGVPEKDIISSGRPKDTAEEAAFVRRIVKDQPYILVTSASHMPRALSLMKRFALNPIPVPTDYMYADSCKWYLVPGPGALTRSSIAIHEYLGRSWEWLKSNTGF